MLRAPADPTRLKTTYRPSGDQSVNKRVGPQQSHQLVLLDEPGAVFDEEQERVERLRRQRVRLAAAQKPAPENVQPKRSEFIEQNPG